MFSSVVDHPSSYYDAIPCLLSGPLTHVSNSLSAAVASLVSPQLPSSLERASSKRRTEFLAGRSCARRALLAAGCAEPGELAVSLDRAPLWPSGWVGSITHSHDRVAAVVARCADFESLGIDSEPIVTEPSARELAASIMSESERSRLLTAAPAIAVSLTFSAKESIYKCLRPLARSFFGMSAAELVEVDPATGTFRFQLLEDLSPRLIRGWCGQGRFAVDNSWIHTAVSLPAEGAP